MDNSELKTQNSKLFHQPIRIPQQIPEAERLRLSGRLTAFDIPKAVRFRLRHPNKITVSEWAEAHRTVTAIDAAPGPWDTSLVPHTKKIMDTIGKPWVRQVWLCMVERSAKTQCLINAVCWGIDRGSASGNIFWLLPTEADARKALGERLIPVFRESPRIKKYLTEYRDDATRSLVRFRHGIRLFAAWANSPGSMASYFGRINMADEIDKFPERTSEGTDPITLFLKRAREDRERSKYVFASTPGQKYIHKGMLACQQIWEYAARCPHCGERHIMIPGNLVPGPGLSGPGYSCPSCAVIWTELDRREAYLEGGWSCTTGSDLPRPETVGFHFPALPNSVIPLKEIIAARDLADAGGYSEKCAWANGYLAINYEQETITTAGLDHLALRIEEYGPQIPTDAVLLTAGADIQQDRIEIEIVAWGVGAHSWGIEYAVLYGDTRLPEVWDQLDRHLLRTWHHATGAVMGITRSFIDAGYLPQQVYRFTGPRRSRGLFAIEGNEQVDAPEVSGPSNRHRAGMAIPVYRLGVNRIKSTLFGFFGIETPGAGYCHLPVTYPDNWFTMIQAEHPVPVDKRQDLVRWEKKKGGIRNEAIDCRCYALAALLSLRVDLKGMWQGLNNSGQPQQPRQRRVYSEGVQT